MSTSSGAVGWRAWLIALIIFGSAVVLSPWTLDSVMLPKFTLVALAAVIFVGGWVWRLVLTGKLAVPWSAPVLSLICFMAAAVLATVTSAIPWMSFFGAEDRHSGLLSYVSYGVLFLAVIAYADRASVRLWTRGVLVSVVPCLLLGLIQAAGYNPLGFIDVGLPGAFSTFGNVNFAGAWSGMLAALLLATALNPSESRGWRIFAGTVLPLDLLYAYLTGTSQALVVGVAALGFAGGLLAWGAAGADRDRFRRPLLVGGLALLALLLFLVMLNWGRVQVALDQALVERPHFWRAALHIWSDNPVFGTGLDTYGQFFLQYRTAEHAAVEGAGTADAPHSVPLAMLSNGGLVLALAYAAFVIAVAVVVVRGVTSGASELRPVLAGWGGVWVGYQVQSLVSFDVPPLAVLHVVSAGVLVGLVGRTRWKEVVLWDRGRAVGRQGSRSPQTRRQTRRPWANAATVFCVAVLGWCVLLPIRADLEAAGAVPLASAGRLAEAAASFDRAAELNPAEGEYLALEAQSVAGEGRMEDAFSLTQQAAEREPGSVKYSIFSARLALELGWQEEAARWYREAARRDPFRVDVQNEVARYFIDRDDSEKAEPYLRRALVVDPDDEEARRLLTAPTS